MSRHSFYDSLKYRTKQAELTKLGQLKGRYQHLKKQETRVCVRKDCAQNFSVQPSSPKRYCSKSCSAKINNSKRRWPDSIKRKISSSLRGTPSPYKDSILVARITTPCLNPECGRTFSFERHRTRKFCSVPCAMKVNGGRPTSPKASRGKAGIRPDIDSSIYFYSRWEANLARLYTHLGILWLFTPHSFDIGKQIYTPDFYLPETDTYIEVKNFWSTYSKVRDSKFRSTHPEIALEVILKEEYSALEQKYSQYIPNWEYKNSLFQA